MWRGDYSVTRHVCSAMDDQACWKDRVSVCVRVCVWRVSVYVCMCVCVHAHMCAHMHIWATDAEIWWSTRMLRGLNWGGHEVSEVRAKFRGFYTESQWVWTSSDGVSLGSTVRFAVLKDLSLAWTMKGGRIETKLSILFIPPILKFYLIH